MVATLALGDETQQLARLGVAVERLHHAPDRPRDGGVVGIAGEHQRQLLLVRELTRAEARHGAGAEQLVHDRGARHAELAEPAGEQRPRARPRARRWRGGRRGARRACRRPTHALSTSAPAASAARRASRNAATSRSFPLTGRRARRGGRAATESSRGRPRRSPRGRRVSRRRPRSCGPRARASPRPRPPAARCRSASFARSGTAGSATTPHTACSSGPAVAVGTPPSARRRASARAAWLRSRAQITRSPPRSPGSRQLAIQRSRASAPARSAACSASSSGISAAASADTARRPSRTWPPRLRPPSVGVNVPRLLSADGADLLQRGPPRRRFLAPDRVGEQAIARHGEVVHAGLRERRGERVGGVVLPGHDDRARDGSASAGARRCRNPPAAAGRGR